MFDFGVDMLYRIPALLAAMTVHEYAHARVAVAMGDSTPRYLGRMTLNPIPHLDPIGLILLFFAGFGWAKPVPVNPRNFHDWRKGSLYVSLAGAGANIALATAAWFFLLLLTQLALVGKVWHNVLWELYRYNLMFAVFNLLPIPPLDGSKVLISILPGRYAYEFSKIEPYGNYILIGLVLIPGLLGFIVSPLIRGVSMVIQTVVGTIVGIIL